MADVIAYTPNSALTIDTAVNVTRLFMRQEIPEPETETIRINSPEDVRAKLVEVIAGGGKAWVKSWGSLADWMISRVARGQIVNVFSDANLGYDSDGAPLLAKYVDPDTQLTVFPPQKHQIAKAAEDIAAWTNTGQTAQQLRDTVKARATAGYSIFADALMREVDITLASENNMRAIQLQLKAKAAAAGFNSEPIGSAALKTQFTSRNSNDQLRACVGDRPLKCGSTFPRLAAGFFMSSYKVTNMTTLVHVQSIADRLPALSSADVVEAFLARQTKATRRAYEGDLRHFAVFLGLASAPLAVNTLLALPRGQANAIVMGFTTHMKTAGLKSATISRRLAAIRSVVKMARSIGRCEWELDVPSPRIEPYRDTLGPGPVGWAALWQAAKTAGDTPLARRNRAIILLLADRGLRRGEAAGLDLADVELGGERQTVAILGKGRTEKEPLTISPTTARALAEWIQSRGDAPGALFTRLDRGGSGERLGADSILRMLGALSEAASLDKNVRPHGLRHYAITKALDSENGNYRDVAKFSRHKNIQTLTIYDDRRTDIAGEIAARIATEW